jgi:hypothetical protein
MARCMGGIAIKCCNVHRFRISTAPSFFDLFFGGASLRDYNTRLPYTSSSNSLALQPPPPFTMSFQPQYVDSNGMPVTFMAPAAPAVAPLTPEEQAAKKKRNRIIGGLIIAGALVGLVALSSGVWMAHQGSKSGASSSSSSVTKTVRTVNAQ